MIDDRECLKLVLRAKAYRSGGPTELSELDEESVTSVVQGIRTLWDMQQRDLGNPYVIVSDPYYASKIEAVRAQMLHDKRCLCSYLKGRLDTLTLGWWARVGADHACPGEQVFVRDHAALMVAYMSSLGGLDLRLATHGPPRVQRYTILRGTKEYAYVSPGSGRVVQVYNGKCLSLPHEDAVALIAAGVVETMST